MEIATSPKQTDRSQVSCLEFRCPQCLKLYRVERAHIQTARPEFACQACATKFCFDFPPRDPFFILTKTLSPAQISKDRPLPKKEAAKLFKDCPHCLKPNPRAAKECQHCQVVLEKAEALPVELKKQGVTVGLIKAWQELIRDYDNLQNHLSFVDRCEDLQALPFALKKYKELREAQPQDSMAQSMFQQVFFRNLRKQLQFPNLPFSKSLMAKWDAGFAKVRGWIPEAEMRRRIYKLSPFAISLVMILVGLSRQGLRNFVGMGAAMLFLTLGLYFLLNGRLHYKDLLK